MIDVKVLILVVVEDGLVPIPERFRTMKNVVS